jgi:TatD DNase family protein
MKLIDSHIHLDFEAFDMDREKLIAEADSAGIKRFVIPATTRNSWLRISQLSARYPSLSVAYGIHPYFIQKHGIEDCEALDAWLASHDCVALGEIGLDYFLKDIDSHQQMKLFIAQLHIAKKHQLPVILHARKAVEEVTHQLKLAGVTHGIVHSFNGSYVQAMRLIEMGLKLGFGGAITYPRATRLQGLVKQLPLDSFCLETDAPDQPAREFAGRRNEPLALIEVLQTISRLRNTPIEIIAQQTTDNAYSVFKFC